ncbi:MAG: PAS domain-containing sensor histidine kinase [Gemmatimonadetes bacterium]|nr:PAS domain-containing sensor histidine kinase [Gemmatimonadota bacterium]NNM04538.1 PAS domain-containing sensor histidine kinase [Gemmatimonadota bacterium]
MSQRPNPTKRRTRSPLRERRGRARSDQPGRLAAWATGLALLFLLLTLLALVLVPMRLQRDVEEVRERIRTVLEPAERLAERAQFWQAREMEAFYSFLLQGDSESRLRYREAWAAEEATIDTLRTLTEGMSINVREEMANLVPLSFSWHLGHQEMLSQELAPENPIPAPSAEDIAARLNLDRATYAEVLSAGEGLRDALSVERNTIEREMTRARFLQAEYTQILVFLGLSATVVVLVLAWRLRTLMKESETRRWEALRARREADGLLRATGDGVLGMDLEGKCTFLNRAGAELLGYSARSVVGRDVHQMLHHSTADGSPLPKEECPILQSLESGKPVSGRNETLWRAGREPFPVQLSIRAMMDGPTPRGAVLSFTDMTETRAAETSLRQAVRARDEVLAVVSHDLRNPVGTIFSAASLLLTFDPPPEKREEHLRAVKRSAERINRLIQDLLDVARLEAGALTVHPAPLDVDSVLFEVKGAYDQVAEDKEISLQVEIPQGLPPGWGDRHRVVQALSNLVENALRETPKGGRVVVGVQADEEAGGLRLFVLDTGPGIPPQDQDRLFDRFWQVSRKDKGGAGLGLSIVKGIVEAHGGDVWVESSVGKGSRFWFSLPAGGPPD